MEVMVVMEVRVVKVCLVKTVLMDRMVGKVSMEEKENQEKMLLKKT